MAKVLCLGCRKPILSNRDGRCPKCKGEVRRRIDANPERRARKARLYDAQHEAERAWWAPYLDAAAEVGRPFLCWRCNLPIAEIGADGHVVFDLGHRGDLPSLPEHRRECNRSAGGRSAR